MCLIFIYWKKIFLSLIMTRQQQKSKLFLQATMIFRNPICRKRIFHQNLYFCHWKEEIVGPVRIVVGVTRMKRNLRDICTENDVTCTEWWNSCPRRTVPGHSGVGQQSTPRQCPWAKYPTPVLGSWPNQHCLGSWPHQHCARHHQNHILKWSLHLQKSSWENDNNRRKK